MEESRTVDVTADSEPRRSSFWFLLPILVVVGAFYLSTLREGHAWGGDFAQYINHARCLVRGTPYHETGYLVNPLHLDLGPQSYPPVFPIALCPAYALFGLSITAFKVQLVVVFLASILVSARLFSHSLRPGRELTYAAVIGFSPVFWEFKEHVRSEHLFILFFYLAILVADQWYTKRKVYGRETVHAVLLGTLIYLACGTRTVGIVLLPSVVVYEFLAARRITRFGVAALGTALSLILIEKIVLPTGGAGYLQQLDRVSIGRIGYNLFTDVTSLANLWENGHSRPVAMGAATLASIFGLLGFCRGNLPKPSFLGVAMVGYAGLILLWPTAAGLRMVVPLLPGYLFYMLLGMQLSDGRRQAERILVGCFCGFVTISYLAWYAAADYGPIEGAESPGAVKLFEFVRENTQDDELCLFFKPRVLCLYADRPASGYPVDPDENVLWNYIDSSRASILIVRQDAGSVRKVTAESIVVPGSSRLREVWRNEMFLVFRVSSGR